LSFAVAAATAAWCADVAPGAASIQQSRLDLSEQALVRAASKYVAAYEKDFAFLIADEDYIQVRLDTRGRQLQSRRLRSELFLTYLPADGEWIAVRDVIDVDGVEIKDREDLRALLARREEVRGITARLVERNAQYNIGRVTRNFNEPTLPLLLLESKRLSLVKFDRRQIARDGDATLVTLAYEERDRPMLVTSLTEGPLPAKGEILLEAGTGVIRRTTFELARGKVDVRLVTTYEKNEKIGLWLPSVFTERYETKGVPAEFREVIGCEAKYTNYRRFEVTAKIK